MNAHQNYSQGITDNASGKLKVLHIINGFLDTSVYSNLLSGLRSHGAASTVVCPCPYGKHIPESIPEYVYPMKSYSNWQRLFFLWKENKILKAVENEKIPVADYDIIHAHTVFTNGYAAWKLAKKYNKPFIVTVRNTDLNIFFRYRLNLRHLGIRILNDAAGVVFLSKSYQKRLAEEYLPDRCLDVLEKKSEIIPNAIYESYFANAMQHAPLSGKKSLRILSVGSILPDKNFTTICEAVKILRESGLDASLQIVGKPVDEKELKKIKRYDFVHYNPPVSQQDLIPFFRNNDIFVLASHRETFGLVYAEAMTQGMPVIYTAGEGFDQQFPDGTVGYGVNDRDPEDIARAIERAAANYDKLSHNSYTMAEKFRCCNVGKQLCEFYHRQIAG